DRGIIVEVALQHTASINRNLSTQRIGQGIDDAALNLLLKDVGVDHLPAIDSRNHTVHSGLVVLHGNLDDFRHVRAETSETGDPLIVAGGDRLTPTGFLGG